MLLGLTLLLAAALGVKAQTPTNVTSQVVFELPETTTYTQGEAITEASQLTTGIYFISVKSNGHEGLIHTVANYAGEIDNSANFTQTPATDANYVWQITVDAEGGTFTVQNVGTNNYLSAYGYNGTEKSGHLEGKQNVGETTTESDIAHYQLKTSLTLGDISHWTVMLTGHHMVGGNTETDDYLHTNSADGTHHLSYWEGGSNPGTGSQCAVAFYRATQGTTSSVTCQVPFELGKLYRIRMRNGEGANSSPAAQFLYYNASNQNVDSRNATNASAFVKERLWYFEKATTIGKFVLRNLAAGPDMALAAGHVMGASALELTVKDNSTASSHTCGFSLDTGAGCLNDQGAGLFAWNDARSQNDLGSLVQIFEVSDDDINGWLDNEKETLGNYLGYRYVKPEVKNAALTSHSPQAVAAMLDFVPTFSDLVNTDRYYRLVFKHGHDTHKAVTATGYANQDGTIASNASDEQRHVALTEQSADNISQLWRFVACTETDAPQGSYVLQNPNANNFHLALPGSDGATGEEAAEHITQQAQWAIWCQPAAQSNNGEWIVKYTRKQNTEEKAMKGDENDDNVHEGTASFADQDNLIYLVEVTTVPVTIGTAGMATLCLPFAATLPADAGVKAYIAPSQEEGAPVIDLTAVEGDVIPAGTGVLLAYEGSEALSEPLTITLTIGGTASAPQTNLLSGSTLRRQSFAENSFYVLKKNQNYFIPNASTLTAMPANRAYFAASDLNLPGTSGETSALRLNFGSERGEATGVGSIATEQAASHTAVRYYDLQGRPVGHPTRGIYATSDGRKVFVK